MSRPLTTLESFEELDKLSRVRRLTDAESESLELAMRRLKRMGQLPAAVPRERAKP